jgi:hypothetical protein
LPVKIPHIRLFSLSEASDINKPATKHPVRDAPPPPSSPTASKRQSFIMETISNVTTGVSKMVFGEKAPEADETEPVSGKVGKGTAEEPYDQGNREGTL